jgi:hypothetical protein
MIDALLFIAILLLGTLAANKLIKAPGCEGDCGQGHKPCTCREE